MNGNKFCIILSVLLLSSCQPKTNFRGNILVSENFGSLEVGKTTQREIMEKCGSPSLHKDELTWIYIAGMSEEIAFRELQIKNKCIIKLKFDKDGVLRSVEKINQQKNRETLMDKEVTALSSEKQIEQKMNNSASKF